MPDIFQDFPIQAPIERVYQAVSAPQGLDRWWTQKSAGAPVAGAEYELGFGPEYEWRAKVTRCVPDSEFELQIVRADPDWTGSYVGFRLERTSGGTMVHFYHKGWPSANAHYRVSCHCWALYLRILRRYLEHGEFVPYEERLDV
jgi:uncharacterized protein YndB with AHSA1/START domain